MSIISIQKSLKDYQIKNCKNFFHNPSYEILFAHEISYSDNKVKLTKLNSIAIDTGLYTGRSPKDKYIVFENNISNDIWWHKDGSDNKPLSLDTWNYLYLLASNQLSGKTLYVMDGYCGSNPKTRLSVRLITEISWMAHFFKNMFIRPSKNDLVKFQPDWVILNACKTKCKDFIKLNLNSSTFIAFCFSKKMTLIGGTSYNGEIKKGIFSIMNFLLPIKGIGSFHCSANQGKLKKDTILFFGLSGTGKTTLSTDSERFLIGDDEHGWDDKGIFNLEGGCYAKLFGLNSKKEPDIFNALKRNALLENVVIKKDNSIDFFDDTKTQNTRASYPIYHIQNITKPISKGNHPKKIIFLTCDAYGVFPAISKLNKGQAMYQYLSGYTAKITGTELGINKPISTFSACFAQPFLLLHPIKYTEILGKKIDRHKIEIYLINTGWLQDNRNKNRKRISISMTRDIIKAIIDNSINYAKFENFPIFNFQVPIELKYLTKYMINPIYIWKNSNRYFSILYKLAKKFIKNFNKFSNHPSVISLKKFGPDISFIKNKKNI